MKPVVEIQKPQQGVQMESPTPGKNALRVSHLRLFFYPAGDLFITDTGSNELFQFLRVDSGKAEEYLVKRTVVMVGSE